MNDGYDGYERYELLIKTRSLLQRAGERLKTVWLRPSRDRVDMFIVIENHKEAGTVFSKDRNPEVLRDLALAPYLKKGYTVLAHVQ